MIYLIAIYVMCGLGVTLGLDDDEDRDSYSNGMRVALFFAFWAGWPIAFMFVVTMALKAVVTGEPNQRPARFRKPTLEPDKEHH